MMNSIKPRLTITLGDPAGIGPEIIVKALQDESIRSLAHWKIIGDRKALDAAASICGLSLMLGDEIEMVDPRILEDIDLVPGSMRAEYGNAAMQYVRIATQMCLRGEADGMVTAPLNKEAVSLSGAAFSGHTEYIAQICGARDSRMLLVNERLSTIHVSTHIALREAVNLESEPIVRTIELGAEAMHLLGRRSPRIAVCGLNPHAGEHGLFGKEDATVIAGAIAEAKRRGIPCEGPLAPDTAFLQGSRGAYDLMVAMYHDQGHIPMKLLDFENTVNVTLGIPIVRTSVDHGTAFDIAGKNQADAQNMKAAMCAGAEMASHKISSGLVKASERPSL